MLEEGYWRTRLVGLYERYCDRHRLPAMSADELVLELQDRRDLTKRYWQRKALDRHIAWLYRFIEAWWWMARKECMMESRAT